MTEEHKRKNLSWSNPSFAENAKEWRPSFYFGQDKMPILSEKDVQKQLYRERRERQEKNYLIAERALLEIYKRNKLAKEGMVDVQKADRINEFDVNLLVKKILKER